MSYSPTIDLDAFLGLCVHLMADNPDSPDNFPKARRELADWAHKQAVEFGFNDMEDAYYFLSKKEETK